jgi:hypothetical protein
VGVIETGTVPCGRDVHCMDGSGHALG